MNELGTTRNTTGGMNIPMPMNPDTGKVEYPTLRLNGEQAALAGFKSCAFGEEYNVMLKVRVKRVGGDSYEMKEGDETKPPIEFDVIASDMPIEAESDSEDEGEDEKTETKKEPATRPKSRVVGPDEAGFSTKPKPSEDEE